MPLVNSSAVRRVDYTATTRTLDIWYEGGDRYSYFEVAPEKYEALLAADSIGTFVNDHVKPCHRFEQEARRRRFRPA